MLLEDTAALNWSKEFNLKCLCVCVYVWCWERKWIKKIYVDNTSDKCCRILKLSLNLIFQDSLHRAQDCCWTLNNEALMPCFYKKTMPQRHFLYKQIGTNCCIAKFRHLCFVNIMSSWHFCWWLEIPGFTLVSLQAV